MLVCLNAFLAVMGLLGLLALAMRLLIALLPEAKPAADPARVAAIHAAAAKAFPGHRVTRIKASR